MLLHPSVLAAHRCRTREHTHNISDANAVQSLVSGVFCIREPYYHADLNAIALYGGPGQVIIRYRTGSVVLRCGNRRLARLFESALESHEKILKPPWD